MDWSHLIQDFLIERVAKYPGLPAKAAQIFSMQMGREPLVHRPTLSLDQIEVIIAQRLPDLRGEVIDIHPDPIPASLGQVHIVETRNLGTLALKFRYPELAGGLERQVDRLMAGARMSPARKYGFDLEGMRDYLQVSLAQELDYVGEAKRQLKYFNAVQSEGVVIPRPYPELTTSEVLVQAYESSLSLSEVCHAWDESSRRMAAQLLSYEFMNGLLRTGQIHGDLHVGNFGFRRSSDGRVEVVLYDFGSVLSLSDEQKSAMATLWRVAKSRDPVDHVRLLGLVGFDERKLERIEPQLCAVIERLLEPFIQERAWSPQDWNLKLSFERILGRDARWFRTAGPPWFLMLMRSFAGVRHAVERLRVRVPLSRITQDILLSTKIRSTTVPTREHARIVMTAQTLNVRVVEGDEEVVAITLPARSVDKLENLIPDEVRTTLEASGIDLPRVKGRVQKSGYRPQTLFSTSRGKRHYEVWLK